MTSEDITPKKHGPGRVLVAPLDWGLGHATRCIPIIKALQNKGVEVFIAAGGRIADLLASEFPGITILPLPGYGIRYSGNRNFFLVRLLAQLPGAVITYFKSAGLVRKWVREYGITAVISDNRPELHYCGVPSFYITHQLGVKTGIRLLDKIASGCHLFFINRFDQCRVPDEEGANNLAGTLSHPRRSPSIPVQYIGCLSRFTKQSHLPLEYDLLVMLSGPEPQRSILEKKILQQLNDTNMKVAMVRGLPGETKTDQHSSITLFNHLRSEELNRLILSSSMVLARCGYSTVMDLVLLGKKAILVPTPGQGEQEYLADHLSQKKYFLTVAQDQLAIGKNLKEAENFDFNPPEHLAIKEEEICSSFGFADQP